MNDSPLNIEDPKLAAEIDEAVDTFVGMGLTQDRDEIRKTIAEALINGEEVSLNLRGGVKTLRRHAKIGVCAYCKKHPIFKTEGDGTGICQKCLHRKMTVQPIKAQDSPGRNDPCPCGSGKKFKRCCIRGESDQCEDSSSSCSTG
jgi:hypothetical protein